MPIYAYQCTSCNKTFEIEQRITDAPAQKCSCGSNGTVKRMIQPLGVVFKGAGFHINDYASGSSAPSTKPADKPACTGNPTSCACSTE